MTSLVRAATLTNYFEVAHNLGYNPQNLLQRLGLSRSMLSDPDQLVPVNAAVRLLEESALESGCQTFGLLMAESRQISNFGAISLLIAHQRTLKDVLSTLIQYRNFLNPALVISMEMAGTKVIIKEEVITDDVISPRQAIELALGVLFRMISALIRERWVPSSVNFIHEAPAQLSLHRRIFGVEVNFGSDFNGIVCSAAELNSINPGADPKMARYAQDYVDTLAKYTDNSLVSEVGKAIYLSLPTGRATIEQIAQSQGLNVRSMQRQLAQSGDFFSELISDVRRDLALRYMENPSFSLSHVAELLGYSMPSSFTRWFRSEFGQSPANWRKINRRHD